MSSSPEVKKDGEVDEQSISAGQQVEPELIETPCKSPELRERTTAASKKRVAATGVECGTSIKSPNRVSKQRRKAAGVKENESGGLHFPSAILPMSPAVPLSAPGQSSQCFQKFKLQLFPIDELTREGLEKDKHNPYLELTLGIRKKISSVVKHLDVK